MLGKRVVIFGQPAHGLVTLDTIDVERAIEVPHDGSIEGNLPELATRVGVGQKQHVHVGFEEDPDRQLARTQKNLRRGFVLSVEDFHHAGTFIVSNPPSKRHMELGSLLEELLDQTADVRSDAPRINPVIVVQILKR